MVHSASYVVYAYAGVSSENQRLSQSTNKLNSHVPPGLEVKPGTSVEGKLPLFNSTTLSRQFSFDFWAAWLVRLAARQTPPFNKSVLWLFHYIFFYKGVGYVDDIQVCEDAGRT